MKTTTDPNERRTELLCELAAEVEILRTSKGWQDWLNFARRFRAYSLGNQMLIHRQRPEATHVAGFRAWQQLGRQVRKGEHGIAILAPMLIKVADNETPGDSAGRRLKGFRVVHVFDISQTDGDDLPPDRGPMPEVELHDPLLLGSLIVATERAGIGFEFTAETTDTARGWYSPSNNRITLVEGYCVASQVRTLLHELGHAHDDGLGDPERTRDHDELVAESVAFIVGTGRFGITMTDASAYYVASWGANLDRLVAMAEQVVKTAERVEQLLEEIPAAA